MKRYNILIVDDEPVNIRLLEKALHEDYEIRSAQNGFEAIRQVKDLMPNLILLDIMMPDLNGFGLPREVLPEQLLDISIRYIQYCTRLLN
jgi:putative two-component system response regulator